MGKTQSIEMSAPTNTNELFCSYAALLLSDCEQDVTEDGINAVVKAAGGSVPASYAAIFAKVAGIKSVSSLVELLRPRRRSLPHPMTVAEEAPCSPTRIT